MVQVYPDVSLQSILAKLIAADKEMILFSNDITPDAATTFAMLVEPIWTGYARQPVLGAGWTAPAAAGGVASAINTPCVFTNSSGAAQDVYGYALLDDGGGEVLFVARFDAAPISIPDGGTKVVIPSIGDFSGVL